MSAQMFDIPEHLAIPVNEWGDGPLDVDEVPYAVICWCNRQALCPVVRAKITYGESDVNGDDPVVT